MICSCCQSNSSAEQCLLGVIQVSKARLLTKYCALWCRPSGQPAPTWCGLNWAQGQGFTHVVPGNNAVEAIGEGIHVRVEHHVLLGLVLGDYGQVVLALQHRGRRS